MNNERNRTADRESYEKVVAVFKKTRRGLTVADLAAKTALPLDTLRFLANDAADEYAGRLEVTESGEILYSFPRGFESRYRGFRARARRFFRAAGQFLAKALQFLFKTWIVVMLVGYFVLFLAIALAALVLSFAASRSNDSRNNGGGFSFAGNVFSLIWRLWFYSELAATFDRNYYGYSQIAAVQNAAAKKTGGRPLHKAVFSFVFGDGDPNATLETRERQAVIAYIQAQGGVVSEGEFLALTGKPPPEAEAAILRYCAEFGGSPEASDDGFIVYRFPELQKRTDTKDRSFASFSAPLASLRAFSLNKKAQNTWFCVINLVNTLFGGYFLSNALSTGAIDIIRTVRRNGEAVYHFVSAATGEASSYLYSFVYALAHNFITSNPAPLIAVTLGVVPLAFSVFFYIIPLARSLLLKKTNEKIKVANLRKYGYNRIWQKPDAVRSGDLVSEVAALRPARPLRAAEQVIVEMGTYSQPDVTVEGAANGAVKDGGVNNDAIYHFPHLAEEKASLEKIRALRDGASQLGQVVFDTEDAA